MLGLDFPSKEYEEKFYDSLKQPVDGETEDERIEREIKNLVKSLKYQRAGLANGLDKRINPYGRTQKEYQEITEHIVAYLAKEVGVTHVSLGILEKAEELIKLKSTFI